MNLFAYYLRCTVDNILVKFSCIVRKPIVIKMSKGLKTHQIIIGNVCVLERSSVCSPKSSANTVDKICKGWTGSSPSLIGLIDEYFIILLLTRLVWYQNVNVSTPPTLPRSWDLVLSFKWWLKFVNQYFSRTTPIEPYFERGIFRYLRLNEDT